MRGNLSAQAPSQEDGITTQDQWRERLEQTKTTFKEKLNAPYVEDIELNFDSTKTGGARFSGNSTNRVIFINPKFAERYKATMGFVLGHEVGHDYFNKNYKDHNKEMDTAYAAGDENHFDQLSIKREFLCDSLGLLTSSEEETKLYFDLRTEDQFNKTKEILRKAIPNIENFELKNDTFLVIKLPMEKELSPKARSLPEQTILRALDTLLNTTEVTHTISIESTQKAKEVTLTELAKEVQEFLDKDGKGKGTHGTYPERNEEVFRGR